MLVCVVVWEFGDELLSICDGFCMFVFVEKCCMFL